LRPEVTVGAGAGCIRVRSFAGRIDRIDVYSVLGMTVFSVSPDADELDIPVPGTQTYVVKVGIGGTETVKKIFVK
ncbi:MAG: hypothetical protein LBP50_05185, partial [Tannerella sp.]|nr:hypothetical protein [Tannerella sp.]